jgi:hypothetical protein
MRADRPVGATLVALFASTIAAIAAVASGRICARAMPMPMDMAGMDGMTGMVMPAVDGRPALCPVVLALVVISALLAAWTLIAFGRDRARTVAANRLARTLARVPVVPAFALLCLGGAGAIAAIVVVDGGVAFSPELIGMLAMTLALGAAASLAVALIIARVALALWTRLALALAGALGEAHPPRRLARRVRRARLPFVDAVADGRGLRAPPLPV